jgi:hypothetical protein
MPPPGVEPRGWPAQRWRPPDAVLPVGSRRGSEQAEGTSRAWVVQGVRQGTAVGNLLPHQLVIRTNSQHIACTARIALH